MGLYQAVTVEKHTVSRGQRHLMFIVTRTGHHPEGHASRAKFRNAAAVSPVGEIVPGIGIVQPTASWIKHSIEAGDKHPRWSLCIEQIVNPYKYLAGREYPLGGGTEHGAGGRHHQGGGYPFICDITDDQAQPAIF